MATVSHTIYSRYAPKNRVPLNEMDIASSPDDPWEAENSFPIRQLREPPRFVPASLTSESASASLNLPAPNESGSGLATWYRSLTSAEAAADQVPGIRASQPLERTAGPSNLARAKKPEAQNKNNWFIQRAIQFEPVPTSLSPPPTLADILARDPPPLPNQAPYVAPVWLSLGPSNKGFSMLQRSGWSEGEGLGPHTSRRQESDRARNFLEAPAKKATKKATLLARRSGRIKSEEREVQWAEDVHEIRNVEVIDLTLSDSEDEAPASDGWEDVDSRLANRASHHPSTQLLSSDSQTILLTPIATVLKSDRLGIGLKAKTIGPHKASMKRVTHSAAAVAAHIKDAEALRRKKAELGRGRRGFARAAKQDQERRKSMLAYLND